MYVAPLEKTTSEMYVAPLIEPMKNDIRDVCSTADWINEKTTSEMYEAPLIGVWEYPKYWVIPETLDLLEISGNTRNSGFTRNIGYYPIFRVTRYPMIFKTESGRVGYRMKYRVSGRVRVPAGPWLRGISDELKIVQL